MIYICGDLYSRTPISEAEYTTAERKLIIMGYDVRSGKEAFRNDYSREKIMRESLKALCDCDGLAMLNSAKQSRQAGFEIKAAMELGIPVMPLKWWLNE